MRVYSTSTSTVCLSDAEVAILAPILTPGILYNEEVAISVIRSKPNAQNCVIEAVRAATIRIEHARLVKLKLRCIEQH